MGPIKAEVPELSPEDQGRASRLVQITIHELDALLTPSLAEVNELLMPIEDPENQDTEFENDDTDEDEFDEEDGDDEFENEDNDDEPEDDDSDGQPRY